MALNPDSATWGPHVATAVACAAACCAAVTKDPMNGIGTATLSSRLAAVLLTHVVKFAMVVEMAFVILSLAALKVWLLL